LPFFPVIPEITDQFLLFRIHRHHRLALRLHGNHPQAKTARFIKNRAA
jgi:hypothetical protein